ncbi:MAG: GIY-YIG nuclease family protein [Ekhidna sp.]|nr:GIY-YIG nuclease family protein [Ekhidna sp.]
MNRYIHRYIYILKLEDNRYYVGITKCVSSRLQDHIRNPNTWTNKYAVLGLSRVYTVPKHKAKSYEYLITSLLIHYKGVDKVRGGELEHSYRPPTLTNKQVKIYTQLINRITPSTIQGYTS